MKGHYESHQAGPLAKVWTEWGEILWTNSFKIKILKLLYALLFYACQMLFCLDIVDCKDCNVQRSVLALEPSSSTFSFILSIFNLNSLLFLWTNSLWVFRWHSSSKWNHKYHNYYHDTVPCIFLLFDRGIQNIIIRNTYLEKICLYYHCPKQVFSFFSNSKLFSLNKVNVAIVIVTLILF